MAPVAARPHAVSAWRHLPNVISIGRIVLVLPVALAIEARWFRLALVFAALAGISDGVDGWLARHFTWRSRLGGVLDPVADKLLLVTCYAILGWIGEAPLALMALVLARDFIIATGALAWHRVLGNFRSRPSWISKWCTVLQILYVVAVLFRASGWWPQLPLAPWTCLVVIFTIVSGLDYIARWGREARDTLRARRAQRGSRDES